MSEPVIASFGGGLNSTAMLINCAALGSPVDLILFSDTGAELPETYAHIERFSAWLIERGMPPVTTVREERQTLEQECLSAGVLPSLAYGFRSCSDKYKLRPQARYVAKWQPAIEAWERGDKVTRLIGFDAGESHRFTTVYTDRRYQNKYPLVEWGMSRGYCERLCSNAGFAHIPKSACFFCPARRKHEILNLRKEHPDLCERALAMEANADQRNQTVKGLGRSWSWRSLIEGDEMQTKLFPEAPASVVPCMCWDGDAA